VHIEPIPSQKGRKHAHTVSADWTAASSILKTVPASPERERFSLMQKENLYLQRRHNNGMHPTANSVALIRKTCR
jgi:hypothetical protein